MPKRTEAYLADQRQRLLRAAQRCFMRHGYHATSIGDICKAAKVSVGTIYKYFPGKREMFLAMHDEATDRFPATLDFESWPAFKEVYLAGIRNIDDTRAKANHRIGLELCSEALFDEQLVQATQPRIERLHQSFTQYLQAMAARGEIELPLGVDATVRMLQCLVMGAAAERSWFASQSSQAFTDELARTLDLLVGVKKVTKRKAP